MNILVAILLSLAVDLVFSSKGAQAELQETPFFAAAVASGALPKVSERVPSVPRIIDLPKSGREIGRPGGTLRILMGDQRDLRFMTLYGYSRLQRPDADLRVLGCSAWDRHCSRRIAPVFCLGSIVRPDVW
jgi:hypothetical protein